MRNSTIAASAGAQAATAWPATPRRTGIRRHPRHGGILRMVIAFVLSLLLHGVALLALFDAERAPNEARRAAVVSVHLVAAQPAAAQTAPAPPRATSTTTRSRPDEARKPGSEPPPARLESARPPAAGAPAATPSTSAGLQLRAGTRPTPKTRAVSNLPRFTEAPANRADDSASTYLRLLALRLAEVKQYPTAAVARHEQGQALLSFRLDRSGRVLAWRIARSSGHDDLDAEVGRMVERAAPFPPFPSAWSAASASFEVPIGFSLY